MTPCGANSRKASHGELDLRVSGLTDDFEAHVTGGASDDFATGVDVLGIEISLLDLVDLLELLAGDRADLVQIGAGGTGRDVGCFLEQHGRGRGLEDESERLVGEDRDHDRQNHAVLVLGLGVELLTKSHDINALCTKCGAYRWGRICRSGRKL